MPYRTSVCGHQRWPQVRGSYLDRVALDYHESEMSDSQRMLKRQLELLGNIGRFLRTRRRQRMLGGERREKKGGRKRDEDDVDTSSLSTKRTTRSQTRTANGGHDGPPSPSQPGSRDDRLWY